MNATHRLFKLGDDINQVKTLVRHPVSSDDIKEAEIVDYEIIVNGHDTHTVITLIIDTRVQIVSIQGLYHIRPVFIRSSMDCPQKILRVPKVLERYRSF